MSADANANGERCHEGDLDLDAEGVPADVARVAK
jgi:hypothetical protein